MVHSIQPDVMQCVEGFVWILRFPLSMVTIQST